MHIFGIKYAIVTGSGQITLQIGLKSLDIPLGNVIVPNLIYSTVPQTIISTGLIFFPIDINLDYH